MPRFLKILILSIYWFFQRRDPDVASDAVPAGRTFIKKYSWFFEWHRFFWIIGRRFFSHLQQTNPLLGDDHQEICRHMETYYNLARRDFQALSLNDKIMHATRHKLAPDTARALCLMYGSTMRIAPFHFGAAARLRALRRIRKICIASFMLFLLASTMGTAGSHVSAWSIMITLMFFVLSAIGWYADSCLLHMACEAERIHNEEKSR